MTAPFIGQVQPVAFNFAPRGWALCDGQIVSIQQYTALFSLLGTMYGGNGTSTFGLPDLRGRVPMSFGTWQGVPYTQGEEGGEENVTIDISGMPSHNHAFQGADVAASSANPADGSALANVVGGTTPPSLYAVPGTLVPLNPTSVAPVGGSQPHSNLQPYLTVNWCIAMIGIYPARN